MNALVMTGFPGFLGSAPLPGLLAKRADARAVCLLPAHHMATAVADLQGTGVECPPFASYAATMLDFTAAHPEVDSSAMV